MDLLIIVNNAAVNRGIHIGLFKFLHSVRLSKYTPRSGADRLYGNSILTFRGATISAYCFAMDFFQPVMCTFSF